MNTIHCPSCSGEVQIKITHCKLLTCDYCNTPLFLEDDSVKNIGEQSSLAEIPSILKLGFSFEHRADRFIPQGRIQYDYGDGIWEEWWVVTTEELKGMWISVDEGDIAIQTAFDLTIAEKAALPNFNHLQIGEKATIKNKSYKVTEKNSATCLGIQGQLPKVVLAGDTMDYIDLSSPKGDIVSVEYDKDGLSIFEGAWIDPFELKAL